jgi:tetratricopeptide (TPR) repeat protein
MALHVFVAMPYGKKEGINFNKVYDDYIKPALEGEGFEVFRADKETRAGSILTDMFQELLLADLVVTDLSIDNPNVWYELGVRHALRARGVVLVQCQREYQPFDTYTDRKLRYRIKKGVPDPAFLDEDKKSLAAMARDTMASSPGRTISPVYSYLPFLCEPDWKSLLVKKARAFRDRQIAWEMRIEVARKKQRPGDILVLADEAPIQALQIEAHRTAGKALRELCQYAFALEQFEQALTIDPGDIESRREKGMLLNRLGKVFDAREWLKKVVEDHPADAESRALLGRVLKDEWVRCWKKGKKTPKIMRASAASEDCLLEKVINTYAAGFKNDPGHYYSGINALTLLCLHKDLTGSDVEALDPKALEGGVRWAIYSALEKKPKDYWAKVTLGDLECLVSGVSVVTRAYKEAIVFAEENWFSLDSSRQQLLLLKDLGFRPPQVRAAIDVFDRALEKLVKPEAKREPKNVFLFSGHMIDALGREPRFPKEKEGAAADEIAAKLTEFGAGPKDIGLCGGACGGDLLFAEACLKKKMRVELRIPFDKPTFLKNSVLFAPGNWGARFENVKKSLMTTLYVMPEELGPAPANVNPYERNNLWQLYTALSMGQERIRFISLWDRKEGYGPGGTKHMYNEVLKHSGQVRVIDPKGLKQR